MTTRRQFLALTLPLALPLALAAPAVLTSARGARAAADEVFNTDGVAVHGTDVVAYFREGRVVDGRPDQVVRWRGAMWRFASADAKAAFEKDPRAFAPQYGGYCAYAMAQGAIATTVPEAWTIYQGRLYLNYSTGVRRIWKRDIAGYVARADRFWPAVLDT